MSLFVLTGAVWLLFGVGYALFYYQKDIKGRHKILDKKYMSGLFEPADNAKAATQGHNDEIPVNRVAFMPEDFQREFSKIDWNAMEKRL